MGRPPTGRRPFSVRLRPETLDGLRAKGESDSEVLRRIVAAGIDALTAPMPEKAGKTASSSDVPDRHELLAQVPAPVILAEPALRANSVEVDHRHRRGDFLRETFQGGVRTRVFRCAGCDKELPR